MRQDGKMFYEELLTALVQKATGVTLQQLPQSTRTNLIWETRRGRARAEASDGGNQAPWLKPADLDASQVFAVKLIQAAVRCAKPVRWEECTYALARTRACARAGARARARNRAHATEGERGRAGGRERGRTT